MRATISQPGLWYITLLEVILLGFWWLVWLNGICPYSHGMLHIHWGKRIIASVSAKMGCILIHTMGFVCYILQALHNDIPPLLSNLLLKSSKRNHISQAKKAIATSLYYKNEQSVFELTTRQCISCCYLKSSTWCDRKIWRSLWISCDDVDS